jgi:hypothetical protein
VQLLGAEGGEERSTANVCTPGTHIVMNGELVTQHCLSSESESYAGDRWVTVEVVVRGGTVIEHLVEGGSVLRYAEPQLDPGDPDAAALLEAGAGPVLENGYIALQAESHPVEFRRVEILPLPQADDEPADDADTVVEALTREATPHPPEQVGRNACCGRGAAGATRSLSEVRGSG